MTNKRIPDLTAATTPLAGTELVPVWDGTSTKQVSVTNLTAGRVVAGTQFTASTGNFIPATSGKGIDFSAVTPAAGMTSKVLTNYEEGTWTPTLATTGVGGIFVQPSPQADTDFPAIFMSDGASGFVFSPSITVMSDSAAYLWVLGNGASKVNNAIRYRLASAVSIASATVDVYITMTGRWK